MPLGVELSHKSIRLKYQGFGVIAPVYHEQGQQKIVPYPHYVKHNHSGGYRFQQRENNLPIGAEGPRAVYVGAFIKFPGNG